MLRAGPKASEPLRPTQQRKQKKRLSFKEPEVDASQQSRYLGEPQPHLRNFSADSTEDRTFEGEASSDFPTPDIHTNFYSTNHFGFENLVETVIDDCSPTEEENYLICEQENSRSDPEFAEEYFSQLPSDMRCPQTFSNGDSIPEKAASGSMAQHQIQLLRYQLDQQSQQTQLVFHQVQLLTDQVEAESAARRKAQEQNNILMGQNQALLKHIEKLFQQIEEMEKQIQFCESGRRPSAIPLIHEPQGIQSRGGPHYSSGRRKSNDQVPDRTTTPQTQVNSPTPKRSSLTQAKLENNKYRANVQQQQLQRDLAPSPKPTEPTSLGKDVLHIGDMSPPVQSSSSSPFSGWKAKPTESVQTDPLGRTRTGSFSSFCRLKPPDNIAGRSGFNTTPGPSGINNKKYSSSTSDLYNTTGVYQVGKSAASEDCTARSRSSFSSITASSKLPRYQAYTGWQSRRSSLVKDCEPSAKEKLKYSTGATSQQMN